MIRKASKIFHARLKSLCDNDARMVYTHLDYKGRPVISGLKKGHSPHPDSVVVGCYNRNVDFKSFNDDFEYAATTARLILKYKEAKKAISTAAAKLKFRGVETAYWNEMNFKEYKINARYAIHINAGYSARLRGDGVDENPYKGEEAESWLHGYNMCDRHYRDESSETGKQ